MTEIFPRKTADIVSLCFGPPVSVNRMYRAIQVHGRTRNLISYEYRKWKEREGSALESQSPACVPGKFTCLIVVPSNCRHDLDNTAKGFLDLLQSHNVIENDRHMVELTIKRGNVKDISTITVKKAVNS